MWPRFEDPSAVFWLYYAQKHPPSALGPVANEELGSQSGKQKPGPVLRNTSMCFVQWGEFCFMLDNSREARSLRWGWGGVGIRDGRWSEQNERGELDWWHVPFSTSLMGHSSCPLTVWTKEQPLLLLGMNTNFLPSVVPFICCISSPSALHTFLTQLLAVSQGVVSFPWVCKHWINMQASSWTPGHLDRNETGRHGFKFIHFFFWS